MTAPSKYTRLSVARLESLEDRRLLAVSAGALDRQFVRGLYESALNRTASNEEIDDRIEDIASSNTTTVASNVLNSREARFALINEAYLDYLGRTPSEADRTNWNAVMVTRGEKFLQFGVITSDEYFALNGGRNDGLVRAWYEDALGRTADNTGLEFWKNRILATSREQAALEFIDGSESLRKLVADWYEDYLGRAPEAEALDFYASSMLGGTRRVDVRQALAVSAEYRDLGTNVVLDWNEQLLAAIRDSSLSPPVASRLMAMTQVAVYDSVNAILGTHEHFLATTTPAAGASIEAAAAAAAHRVLVNAFPSRQATLDAALAASLAHVTDTSARDAGVTVGQNIADQVIAARASDGSTATVVYTPSGLPGRWKPTPTAFAPALLPQWGDVDPFAMTTSEQFRFNGPPDITTAQYAADLNEVKSLGQNTSATRTADQTQIAQFWADGAGTSTPPGHWFEILQEVSALQGRDIAQSARFFATLGVGMADAAIACWDNKYAYDFWRPVTAVREADTDGNAATTADVNWTPLIATPPFPEYTSGHSTFSGAADVILTTLIGQQAFTSTNGVATRSYTSFNQAANEAGASRVYGGIHFQTSNQHGLASGRALGNYIIANFFEEL